MGELGVSRWDMIIGRGIGHQEGVDVAGRYSCV